MRDHLQRLGAAAKEMLAHVSAIVCFEGLVVSIQRVHHDLAQCAVFVASEQGIPAAAPEAFDDVPACATEFAFQLLNDLAVAAHRAIQAL